MIDNQFSLSLSHTFHMSIETSQEKVHLRTSDKLELISVLKVIMTLLQGVIPMLGLYLLHVEMIFVL